MAIRWPAYCSDPGAVPLVIMDCFIWIYIPQFDEVIVTTSSKLISISGPIKASNLVRVMLKCSQTRICLSIPNFKIMINRGDILIISRKFYLHYIWSMTLQMCQPEIWVELPASNGFINTTWKNLCSLQIPFHSLHPQFMAMEWLQARQRSHIKYLHTWILATRNQIFSICRPIHTVYGLSMTVQNCLLSLTCYIPYDDLVIIAPRSHEPSVWGPSDSIHPACMPFKCFYAFIFL